MGVWAFISVDKKTNSNDINDKAFMFGDFVSPNILKQSFYIL
jgi:hypothetical protein